VYTNDTHGVYNARYHLSNFGFMSRIDMKLVIGYTSHIRIVYRIFLPFPRLSSTGRTTLAGRPSASQACIDNIKECNQHGNNLHLRWTHPY
jgi:hypothetical protein